MNSSDALRAKLGKTPSSSAICKFGKKNVIIFTGLKRKFPVSLYASEWLDLLDKSDDIMKFIKDNLETLSQEQPSE